MPDLPLTLSGHLDELRKRIFPVLFSLIFFSAASFYFAKDLIWILKWPASGQIDTLAVFSPTAAILAYIKISLAVGLIFSLPVLLYEAWMFVLPALGRGYAGKGLVFIFSGTLLFILGATFNFFILLPASIKFLMELGKDQLQFIISLDSYVSFVLFLALGGGLVFELPLLVFALAKFGILTAGKIIRGWRVAIVGILIAAAVLTPTPDVVNMILMSLPMFFLYFVCIGVAALAERGKKGLMGKGFLPDRMER